MKVLIEKHPALIEKGDPGELYCQIETIPAAEIFHYFFSYQLISFQLKCLVNKLGQKWKWPDGNT